MIETLTRLEAAEAIRAVMPAIAAEFKHYAAVDVEFLAKSWAKLMEFSTTKTYGLRLENEWKGFLLGGIQPELLTGRLQAVEFLWAVKRGVRGHALKLLKQFEKDGKENGADWVVIGATALADPSARRLLYKRLGYVPHGETFYKRF